MAFICYLPGDNGEKIEYGTNSNSVIIIGANGAGKSKLGAGLNNKILEMSIELERKETLILKKTYH